MCSRSVLAVKFSHPLGQQLRHRAEIDGVAVLVREEPGGESLALAHDLADHTTNLLDAVHVGRSIIAISKAGRHFSQKMNTSVSDITIKCINYDEVDGENTYQGRGCRRH